MKGVEAVRAYVRVESDGEFPYFTGSLVKTVIYALARELTLFHGMRGSISPIHISPLFKPGHGEYALGTIYTPVIIKNGKEETLETVPLTGDEYIIHIGGEANLVKYIDGRLEAIRTPLKFKYKEHIVTFKLEEKENVTKNIEEKTLSADRITLYLKGPVKPFNVLAPSRLPKFSPSAYEILMTGYMIYRNTYTLMYQHVLEALKLLGMLVETYYSLNTIKPILVPFKEGKEPALIGKITYIVDTKNREIRNTLRDILNISEIAGVGESRTNGFGTVTWSNKR
ncbi:MAG: CRISPR system precrRNA processing endoribonuclease RAMP protein Cas6 [Desulfurococcales archaeon]|nr:CRISPR system precrRNA processing endoribonuclease RAMP protein Cas6 [Desulfurococcales archaeon]